MLIASNKIYININYELVKVLESLVVHLTTGEQIKIFKANIIDENGKITPIFISENGSLCEQKSGTTFYAIKLIGYILEENTLALNIYQDFIGYQEVVTTTNQDNTTTSVNTETMLPKSTLSCIFNENSVTINTKVINLSANKLVQVKKYLKVEY